MVTGSSFSFQADPKDVFEFDFVMESPEVEGPAPIPDGAAESTSRLDESEEEDGRASEACSTQRRRKKDGGSNETHEEYFRSPLKV